MAGWYSVPLHPALFMLLRPCVVAQCTSLGGSKKTMDILTVAANAVLSFVVLYPLGLCWMGMAGAWLFRFKWESPGEEPPSLQRYPRVSFLVCCDASPEAVERTLMQLEAQRYPNLEILALHDATAPAMGPMLDRLLAECPRLRTVYAEGETQRAVFLRTGAMLAQGEFLVCVEAGALVDAEALQALLGHFLGAGRVGAVVGQVMVVQPERFLEQMAAAEYSLRAHTLPRAAAIYGKQVVLPDGLVAYRKSALHQVGYWNLGASTPELELLWNLQAARWGVRFEPKAQYWIDPPRGIDSWLAARGAWCRQLREAMRVLRPALCTWRNRRLWLFRARQWFDSAWCIAVWAVLLYLLASPWLTVDVGVHAAWPIAAGVAVVTTSLTYALLVEQLAIVPRPSERAPLPAVLLAPSLYWFLNFATPGGRRRRGAAQPGWEQPSVSAR